MIKEGFRPELLYTIHNSLDYERQLELRRKMKPTEIFKFHFHNNNRTIIVIGRLNARKKLEMLLDAVRNLNKTNHFYNVVFIGDGDERQKLEELTVEYEIVDQVWFYGACYDEVVNAELIFNADVCVMPGDIGLTAIHCLSFGTPCITHDDYPHQGPEFEAIQEGKTGSFFHSGDVSSLMNTLICWFSTHENRDSGRNDFGFKN